MDRETLISVNGVTRYYGSQCAVDDVSFTMNRGEVLGFLGPNGAGKTTTMLMLSGALAPTRGTISIAGHALAEQPRAAKSHIGFLPEQPPLYPDLSVDQYLDYCARLRRVAPSRRKAALENARARCGLADVGARLIGNLSKGYQQRVGIAQAIIHSPAVVIMDEPTVGLDPNQIVEIRDLIAELGEDHGVILSTHILSEVQAVCERVLIINAGRLVIDEHIDSLQRGGRGHVCIVALANPPSPEELERIDGVSEARSLDRGRFRLLCRNGRDTAAAIARAAAAGHWDLYELTPEADSLEDTFMRLTRGELPPAAP